MFDCLHQKMNVGDFLFIGGKGNGPAEYGMQVKKVLKIEGEKIQIVGFDSVFRNEKWNLRLIKSVPQNLNKYLIHEPPEKIKNLLNRLFSEEELLQYEIDFLASWSHAVSQK